MKQHKTGELTGALLDLAVALAEGHRLSVTDAFGIEVHEAHTGHLVERTDYSTDWSVGGPIIEREALHLEPFPNDEWLSFERADGWGEPSDDSPLRQYGPTALIAAMRAYVASKLGHEVELPDGAEE